MDTQTQIDRLIELAIIQRSELKQLVEQLPQLREHLNAEVEKVFDETEPQLRAELEEWTTKQTSDKTAALGVALEAKIADLAKSLEVSTQARYNAIIAEREENARLAAQAEAKIAEHAASLPSAVKEIVSAELARFPRAGEIDQLRKEFAEPRGLNPRGKWQAGETYNRLDLVTYNGDSFVSNIDGNTEKPSRNAANWTLNAARGAYGGGGGITSLNDVLNAPTSGQIIGSQNGQYVPKTLVAGANITINETASAITIIGDEGQISLQDGTAAAPSLFFTNDTDTGIYRPAANTLGISVSGTQVAYFDANGITTVGAGATFDGSVHAANGNANNPSFSFTSDQDTGFFRHQPNEIGVSLGGTQKATLTSTTFTITPNLVVSGTGSINGTSIPASKTLVVTTDKLSALASTSSSELAGVISDETGTGALVFANTPTLVTPVIGAATGTSLTLTGNVTASDSILGTSGPSVKSSLSARAPRQGLVFDGTAGATVTSVPAFGTADYSIAAWLVWSGSSAQTIVDGSSSVAFFVNGNGGVAVFDRISSSTKAITANGVVTAGKPCFVTYTRAGQIYVNGLASGAVVADTSNYTGTIGTVGQNYDGSQRFSGFLAVNIYNRSLSASEVVALYEAGAPAGADYNSASNTSKLTGANSDFSSAGNWTVTGSTTISGGKLNLSNGDQAYCTPGNISVAVGGKFRVKLTVDSITAGSVQIYTGAVGGWVNIATAAGTFTQDFTFAATSGPNTTLNVKSTGGNAVVDTVLFYQIGLLLAPDAAQAGGGLVWYDTSGNAANITLPASGVSWNVPSSRYLGGNWTTSGNMTVSGGALTLNNASESYVELKIAGTTKGYLDQLPSTLNVLGMSGVDVDIYAGGNNPANRVAKFAASGIATTLYGNLTVSGGTITSGSGTLTLNSSANTVVLQSAGTTALTLDASQNATFAGTIKPQQAATASAPTYVKGAIYFDTTLNKLRVGGATGWETITSV